MGQKDVQLDARRARKMVRERPRAGAGQESEFINMELSKEETATYRIWREDVANVVDLWTELIEGGYRVSSKYDDYSSSCAVFVIPSEGGDNAGYILSGRGGNAYRALAEAIFKHFEVLHGNWSNFRSPSAGTDDPDF